MERADTRELPDEYRIVVIGKTGNGKSSVCNAILGKSEFTVGRSMASTTVKVQQATTEKNGKGVKVVDTPDIANMPEEMNPREKQKEISEWQRLTAPSPSAILLAVRCDVRYTAEEYDIYREIKFYWGDNFCKHLVVLFTFGDSQDGHFDEELHTVCPELKSVLKDARNRYVVFDETKEGNGERLWESLCTYMTELAKPPTSPPPPQWHDIVIVTVVVFMIGVLLVFVLLILHDSYAAIAVGVICLICLVLGLVLAVWRSRRSITRRIQGCVNQA